MRAIAIGGEPATGKSAIMLEVLRLIGPGPLFTCGLCRGTLHQQESVAVIGLYDGSGFPGTDRLSMGVQPDAVRFVRARAASYPESAVVFEGDRLFNAKFLGELASVAALEVFVVTTEPVLLDMRHALARADAQSETWLAGRRTKVANIRRAFPHTVLSNNLPEDVERNARLLAARLIP